MEEKDLERLKEILEWYANEANYYTRTQSYGQYIVNGRKEEKYSCTEVDPSSAKEGLELLKKYRVVK